MVSLAQLSSRLLALHTMDSTTIEFVYDINPRSQTNAVIVYENMQWYLN